MIVPRLTVYRECSLGSFHMKSENGSNAWKMGYKQMVNRGRIHHEMWLLRGICCKNNYLLFKPLRFWGCLLPSQNLVYPDCCNLSVFIKVYVGLLPSDPKINKDWKSCKIVFFPWKLFLEISFIFLLGSCSSLVFPLHFWCQRGCSWREWEDMNVGEGGMNKWMASFQHPHNEITLKIT